MHFPVQIGWGAWVLDAHFVFELLAYSAGFRYYLYLRKRQGDAISDEGRWWIFLAAVVGGLVGSRVVGFFEHPLTSNPAEWAYRMLSSKTILGGLLGGLVAIEITKKRLGITTSSGDLMTYPIILGMAIGRAGCFLAGLNDGTYGVATTLPWGIDLGDGISRHPTSLYEILFLIILGLALYLLERRYSLQDGARFKLFLASYLVFRFAIDFLKPAYPILFYLTSVQVAALCGVVYYRNVFIRPLRLISQ